MGLKGDKLTGTAVEVASSLVDVLSVLGEITSKRMFGGVGVFHEGKMFAMVNSKGGILFKVDDSNKAEYEAKGETKHGKMPYYSVPVEILSDDDKLVSWASTSIGISK